VHALRGLSLGWLLGGWVLIQGEARLPGQARRHAASSGWSVDLGRMWRVLDNVHPSDDDTLGRTPHVRPPSLNGPLLPLAAGLTNGDVTLLTPTDDPEADSPIVVVTQHAQPPTPTQIENQEWRSSVERGIAEEMARSLRNEGLECLFAAGETLSLPGSPATLHRLRLAPVGYASEPVREILVILIPGGDRTFRVESNVAFARAPGRESRVRELLRSFGGARGGNTGPTWFTILLAVLGAWVVLLLATMGRRAVYSRDQAWRREMRGAIRSCTAPESLGVRKQAPRATAGMPAGLPLGAAVDPPAPPPRVRDDADQRIAAAPGAASTAKRAAAKGAGAKRAGPKRPGAGRSATKVPPANRPDGAGSTRPPRPGSGRAVPPGKPGTRRSWRPPGTPPRPG
jgi:hypothetical protein